MDSTPIYMAACRSLVQIATEVYPAWASEAYKAHRLVPQAVTLPVIVSAILMWLILWVGTHHARAGENIPTKAKSVPVLDLGPLLFQGFDIHLAQPVCPVMWVYLITTLWSPRSGFWCLNDVAILEVKPWMLTQITRSESRRFCGHAIVCDCELGHCGRLLQNIWSHGLSRQAMFCLHDKATT